MKIKRTDRLNSLLKEVLSEVIHRELQNSDISEFTTVTSVDITSDLHYAKVFISVIGTPAEKEKTIKALQKACGYIAKLSSKKVVMRFFPALTFKLDTSVDEYMNIEKILSEIKEKKDSQ